MALNGIPINSDDCIGASLVTINGAFQTLDARTITISGNYIPKPASPTDKQVLTWNGTTNTWVASATTPATDIYSLSSLYIRKPASPEDKQILTWNGTTNTWVASAAPVGGGGAGAVGGGTDKIFWENDINITTNYTITSGKNAGTFGPVTINPDVTITIPDGSTWTVV